MIWVEITYEDAKHQLPTDLRVLYEQWLDEFPEKEGRLELITDNTIREFRDAIKSNHDNQVDPRETYLPQSCVRHCYALITHSIAMEMGIPMTGAGNSLRTAADIFLRTIPFGRWKTTTEDGSGLSPSPRFVLPDRSRYGHRALPIVLLFICGLDVASAGWIRPDRQFFDWQINPTYVPKHFTNTTTSLYGHLQGIDNALASKATLAQLNAAIAGIETTNTVDATARALAETASLSANAALTAMPNYLPLTGGMITGSLALTGLNESFSVGRSHAANGPATIHFEVRQTFFEGTRSRATVTFRDTHQSAPVSEGNLRFHQNLFSFDQPATAPQMRSDVFVFPAGDYLHGDGVNLFYTSADGQTTTQITNNGP